MSLATVNRGVQKSGGHAGHPTALENFRQEVDDLLARLWVGGGEMLGRISPNLDLSETDDAIDVKMDLPGIKPADIDIKVSDHLLTISGERSEKREEKGRTFHRVERQSGAFSRSITLPCTVCDDKADAHYKDGVLHVRLPKSSESVARKVAVKTS